MSPQLAELLEENKRLNRINFGRVVGIVFFLGWTLLVCVYLTSPSPNTQSCKVLQAEKLSKK